MENKKRAPRNRTITLTSEELTFYSKRLITLSQKEKLSKIINKTIHQDIFKAIDYLPGNFVDLLFIDPPYNMYKIFNSNSFTKKSFEEYTEWVDSFVSKLVRILKPTASIYFCGDWRSSTSIQLVLSKYFRVHNRITWEREKGRGSRKNWKNNSEDVWYCTMSEDYIFNAEDVKLKRKVIAPYREKNGIPKDWQIEDSTGFRLTYPSNIWTDLSIPFWSMPENTDHPTQKPEKLLAKIILASTNENNIVFDPFAGSGTTAVVAKKLNRRYVSVEMDKQFAAITEKRLDLAEKEKSIQGYFQGIFWERNSYPIVKELKKKDEKSK